MRIRRTQLARRRRVQGLSQEALAVRLGVERSTVARWETGISTPMPWVRPQLAEHLGVTLDDIEVLLGTASGTDTPSSSARPSAEGARHEDRSDGDPQELLAGVPGVEPDVSRRTLLGAAASSVLALSLSTSLGPLGAVEGRAPAPGARVGGTDVDAVHGAVAAYSRLDQRHGGGHARQAAARYLTTEVAPLLGGRFADAHVRRGMFSAAAELAYVTGWMAFDDAEHSTARRYFRESVRLATEAGDQAMAAHTLRAMAHQAVELGRPHDALAMAEASVDRDRYRAACHRERALLGVVHARALAASGLSGAAAATLLRAEDDLARASAGDEEPARVFFFSEASLAHETGRTLLDTGDLAGAQDALARSVRIRKATPFARTHAVTLGYLGEVQATAGDLDRACETWSDALGSMGGVRSARARATVQTMRTTLAPAARRGHAQAAEVGERAAAYLAAA